MDRTVVSSQAVEFAVVLDKELGQIDARRRRHGQAGPEKEADGATQPGDPLARAREKRLVGLAFSGGGIRSATFR
jgi:hypothetical protein